jgi:hypothetical protein
MIGQQVVYRLSEDGLTQESWTFTVVDLHIVLSRYTEITKASKRHGFKWSFNMPLWDRHQSRMSNISEDEVPFPESVKSEIYKSITNRIVVIKWCDYKR